MYRKLVKSSKNVENCKNLGMNQVKILLTKELKSEWIRGMFASIHYRNFFPPACDIWT